MAGPLRPRQPELEVRRSGAPGPTPRAATSSSSATASSSTDWSPRCWSGSRACEGVNLAAARAPTLLTYFVLRRALESGARPSAIVIDTKPAVLIGGVDYNAHYWPAALSPRECLELGRIAGKGTLGLAVLTARLLPSLQARLEVRSRHRAALTRAPDPIREINRSLSRNWTVNGGANVAMLDSPYRGELSPDIQDRLHPDRWYVDRANAAGLDALLKLAGRRGSASSGCLPPISPGLQEWRERSGSEAKFEQFVRSYAGATRTWSRCSTPVGWPASRRSTSTRRTSPGEARSS